MTRERQDITEDFYEGDTKDIQVTIYTQAGSLKDLTGAEISYALIRDDAKNPVTVLRKSSAMSEIEVLGTGVCVIHLLPGDTVNVYGTFRHQVHVVDADGNAGIVTSGKVLIFRSFARRPRTGYQTAYISG